jgi:hypothetical protein
MQLRKYMVVKFKLDAGRRVIHIHHLLQDYHWEAIDGEHVLLVGRYHANSHGLLDSHPDVLVFPSLQSSVAVLEHATARSKAHLFEPLRRIGADKSHSAYEIVSMAVDAFGVRFEPEI